MQIAINGCHQNAVQRGNREQAVGKNRDPEMHAQSK